MPHGSQWPPSIRKFFSTNWYAFGRSMDKEMVYDPKIEFVCVSSKASKDVWDFLSKL